MGGTKDATMHALRDVAPDDLRSFLVGKGWVEDRVFDGRGARWTRAASGGEHQVLVPYDRALDDYVDRVYDVVAAVAQTEARTEAITAEELTHIGSDLVHICVPSD